MYARIFTGPPDDSFERIDRALHKMIRKTGGAKNKSSPQKDNVQEASVAALAASSPASRTRSKGRGSMSRGMNDEDWADLYIGSTAGRSHPSDDGPEPRSTGKPASDMVSAPLSRSIRGSGRTTTTSRSRRSSPEFQPSLNLSGKSVTKPVFDVEAHLDARLEQWKTQDKKIQSKTGINRFGRKKKKIVDSGGVSSPKAASSPAQDGGKVRSPTRHNRSPSGVVKGLTPSSTSPLSGSRRASTEVLGVVGTSSETAIGRTGTAAAGSRAIQLRQEVAAASPSKGSPAKDTTSKHARNASGDAAPIVGIRLDLEPSAGGPGASPVGRLGVRRSSTQSPSSGSDTTSLRSNSGRKLLVEDPDLDGAANARRLAGVVKMQSTGGMLEPSEYGSADDSPPRPSRSKSRRSSQKVNKKGGHKRKNSFRRSAGQEQDLFDSDSDAIAISNSSSVQLPSIHKSRK